MLLSNGTPFLPAAPLTELRVILGTAALLAVVAVFALTLGALFGRSILAIIVAIATIILPIILSVFQPLDVSQWLLRVTPAAGFAIQQSIPEYPHVIGLYVPLAGFYPLTPWAGFVILGGYTALTFGITIFVLRHRDA